MGFTLRFIKSLLKNNLKPKIEILDICLDCDRVFWESFWIEQLTSWGFKLTNSKEAQPICFFTDEVIEKIRKKSLGRKHSAESIEKMRQSKIGHQVSDETKLKLKKINTGKKISQETRNKMSEKRKIIKISEETKKKISLSKKGEKHHMFNKKHTEESRKKISNNLKKKINQFDLNLNFIKKWNGIKDAAINLKIDASSISKCCKKKSKTCGGFIWNYD